MAPFSLIAPYGTRAATQWNEQQANSPVAQGISGLAQQDTSPIPFALGVTAFAARISEEHRTRNPGVAS